MENIIIEKDLSSEIILWRYMSLDKFIDLIDSSELFLSPLAFYENTDPFEGLMPLPVKKMLLDSTIKIHKELISNYSSLKSKMHNNPEVQTELKKIGNDLINNIKTAEIKYISMVKSTKVNCWHNNTDESEAMWKLYSQQNNGIAIKTSIEKISKSILTDKLL
ncbi:hypothetical protein [Hafnia alvei]|uniref:hypothetical protein n=1 Tax=Hafnia alvei TaxID=569 RepID=UPI001412E2DF|nr:hypothetical protein [Hafnia alvei]QIP55444.1 hypothetical protein HBA19_07385 [Hafnia alvei]